MIFSSQQSGTSRFHANANTIFVGEKPNSVSFSGCGFLGMYHIGVASCLKMHAPNWVKNIDRVYGCSAGSIVGAMLLSDVCFGEACERMMNIVKDIRSRYLGPFSPGFKLNDTLLHDMRYGLPEDAHIKASGKLYISLTRFPDFQNVIVSDYQSREELIEVLLCSCFVPFYSGLFPPKYRGVRYVDGGLSNNLPAFHDTITVSPWSGNSDICPRNDAAESLVDVNFVNTSIQITASNLYRISTMFIPPNPDVLTEFCSQGFRETVQYLRDHGLFETIHPLRKNLSFSTLLHKVDERRKITRRMSYTARCFHKNDHNHSADISATASTSTDDQVFLGTEGEVLAKKEDLEECFEEDEGVLDVLTPLRKEVRRSVFTVVQVYSEVVDDRMIRLQFQLPSPVLDALESSLEDGSRYSWKKPLSKFLSTCRKSIVVQVPLEKTYLIACFVLRHSASLPSDVAFLVMHLRLLVNQLHTYFQCSGKKFFEKLNNLSTNVLQDIAHLVKQITIAVHIITEVIIDRSLPLYTAMLMLLWRTKSVKSIFTSGNMSKNTLKSPIKMV